jgi:uncharacterized Zn-finger protein
MIGIAANRLALSKDHGGLPVPGFFDCARRLGRFAGDSNGQDVKTFHTADLYAVFARRGGSRDNKQEDIMFVETRPRANLGGGLSDPQHSQQPESVSGSGYPKFRNDHGLPEISIGVREFKCIGMSPPQDHPHVYVNMGEADTILCPYCATRFRFDPRLTPLDADPPDSFFAVDANPGQ